MHLDYLTKSMPSSCKYSLCLLLNENSIDLCNYRNTSEQQTGYIHYQPDSDDDFDDEDPDEDLDI